jgi:hypothetical protein
MLRFIGRLTALVPSHHDLFSAAFITNIAESRFSVHTTGRQSSWDLQLISSIYAKYPIVPVRSEYHRSQHVVVESGSGAIHVLCDSFFCVKIASTPTALFYDNGCVWWKSIDGDDRPRICEFMNL